MTAALASSLMRAARSSGSVRATPMTASPITFGPAVRRRRLSTAMTPGVARKISWICGTSSCGAASSSVPTVRRPSR